MKLDTKQELLNQIIKFTKEIKADTISDTKLNKVLKILLMANGVLDNELDLIDTTENTNNILEIKKKMNNKIELQRNYDKNSDEDWIIKGSYGTLKAVMKIIDKTDYYATLENDGIEIDGLTTQGNDKEANNLEIIINRKFKNKINERLYKHFDNGLNETKILKAKTKDTDFEVNEYYEHNLLQALNNSQMAEQSDINRIKSLKNTGATLTEAIKTVIPKRKHNQIFELVEVQREKYKEFKKVQQRLL